MSARYFKESKVNNGSVIAKWAEGFDKTAKTVYEKSMALLANPKLYNAEQFAALLAETHTEKYKETKETRSISSDEFRLWMRGRQLIIALRAGKTAEAAQIAEELQTTITPELYGPTGTYGGVESAFACWALGYLQTFNAVQNPENYAATAPSLQAAVQYQRDHYNASSPEQKKAIFSDVMWSYTMAIQAAAIADDKSSYFKYLKDLGTLTGAESTPAASIRALPNDQFPAWLASIMYVSARRMKDPQAVSIGMALDDAYARSSSVQDQMLSQATQLDCQQQLLAVTLLVATDAKPATRIYAAL